MSAPPQTRPARSRVPQRSSRNVAPAENPTSPTSTPNVNESDEFRALRRKYAEKLTTIKEMFPAWSDEDILSLLGEVNGSLEVAVTRISEGHAEQWSSASRKKDKKSASSTTAASSANTSREGFHRDSSTRGGRGRGGGPSRGGRGGARGARPWRDQPTNGHSDTAATVATSTADTWPSSSTKAEEDFSSAVDPWGATSAAATGGEGGWGTSWGASSTDMVATKSVASEAETNGHVERPVAPAAAAPAPKTGSLVPPGTKLSWAQITKPKEVPKSAPPAPVAVAPAPVSTPPIEPAPTIETPESPAPPAEEEITGDTEGWEDPTTVQPPIWDDDPAQWASSEKTTTTTTTTTITEVTAVAVPSIQPISDWQDPAIVSISSSIPSEVESQQPHLAAASTNTVTTTTPSISASIIQPDQTVPAQLVSSTAASSGSPPGLPTPATSKPSTPSAKNATAARSARYKSDQPVIMPGHVGGPITSSFSFGSASIDRVGMQFGSLTLGDDLDALPKEPILEVPKEEPAKASPVQASPAVPSAVQQPTPQPSQIQQPTQAAQPTTQPAQQPVSQQLESSLPTNTLPSQHSQQQQPQQQQQQSQQAPPPTSQSQHIQSLPQQANSVGSLYQQQHHLGGLHTQSPANTTTPSHFSAPPSVQNQPQQQQASLHAPYSQHAQQQSADSRLGHPAAHSSYYRGPESGYYNSPNVQPSAQQDTATSYNDFSSFGQQSHLGGFGSAPADYNLYGDHQRGSYYDSYGQGASTFQGRNGSVSQDDVSKNILPSQLQTNTGLQQGSSPNPTGQTGPPVGPGQGAQPPANQQPSYPGMPTIPYYYPQPYSQAPYYGQYGAYPPPQPQYMKYQALYQHGPSSSPAAHHQQPSKPPSSISSPYGSNQSQHIYHPGQQTGYDDYSQSTVGIGDPYNKPQGQGQLYGQGLQNSLSLPSGAQGGFGTSPGTQQQAGSQQRGAGSQTTPESYKQFASQAANGAGSQDKGQQGQQQGPGGRSGSVSGAGVGSGSQQQQQGQGQQAAGRYFPNQYAQQQAQTARSYGHPDQAYYGQYPQYWQ